jgi:uncharacterized protein (TIGR02996 family)
MSLLQSGRRIARMHRPHFRCYAECVTDHDALLRAICDCPDDDTPRLIYADFLEETGDADRAAFVRAQVELARTRDWEPFAVECRTRRTEWSEIGEPFRPSLPAIPASSEVSWHVQPFRRGLGWRVNVHSLHGWADIAPRLYEVAPVGELYLNPRATLDDWRAFAAGEWVRHFRIIHLDGTSPVEPIRALCENPAAGGITEIYFHRASSPGLPELIEDLLATPLGRGLRGLHFSVGYQSLDVLIDSLGNSGVVLDRLSFHTMGLTPERLNRLLQTPLASELQSLSLKNDRLREEIDDDFEYTGLLAEWPARLPESLRELRIENSFLRQCDLEDLAANESLERLRLLDLSRNAAVRYSDDLFDLPMMQRLNVLELRGCQFIPETWRRLVQARVWTNLVSLDLRGNAISEPAERRLLEAPPAPHLIALRLDSPSKPLRSPLPIVWE